MLAIMAISLACWIGTVLCICKRQSGFGAFALILLSFFIWPLALIISLCCGGKPTVQIVYNVTAAQLPPELRN